MALPEQVNGGPLEVWAIERFLSIYSDRHVERTIQQAIEDGGDPVSVAASFGNNGGMAAPNTPFLSWRTRGIEVRAKAISYGNPPDLLIPYSRVVAYVRGEYAEQTSLF